MKRLIFLSLILASNLFADAPAPYPITVNSRAAVAPPLTVYRANKTTIRVSFVDGSTASTIATNETPFLAWWTSNTAASVVTADYSIVSGSTGVVDFTFSQTDLNYTAGRYGYEVGVKDSSAVPSVYRQGVFVISGSPIGTGATPTTWTSNIVWGLYSYIGTLTNGPVRPDNSTVTAATNSDGSITLSAVAAAVTWTNITDKPFTNMTDINQYETDPVFTNWLATNAYVKAETDPVWSAVSNLYYLIGGAIDYAWITNQPSLFTPTDWESDYATDYADYTNTKALAESALQTAPVTSVAGRTNDVVITSSDLADFQTAVDTNTLVAGAAQIASANAFTATNSFPAITIGTGTNTSTLTWNPDEDTQAYEYTHPDGGTVTINGETYRMWKNADTVAITNGQPVCLFSGAGRIGRIKLADADDPERNCVVGVYTGEADLPVDGIGRITRFGAVKATALDNLVDGTWEEGSILNLSTNAGRYTTNSLAAPIDQIQIAVVTYDSPSGTEDDIEVAVEHIRPWSVLDARYVEETDDTYTNTVALAGSALQSDTNYAKLNQYNVFASSNLFQTIWWASGANIDGGIIFDAANDISMDAVDRFLYAKGSEIWEVEGTGTNGNQIMSYDAVTGLGYITAPPANDTTTTNMTQAVTVPTQSALSSNSVIANTEYVDRAVAAGGGGGSGGGIDYAEWQYISTNDMSVLRVTNSLSFPSGLFTKINVRGWAASTNLPLSKDVQYYLYAASNDVMQELQVFMANLTLEADNPTTNLVSGTTEIGYIALANIFDGNLCYVEEGATSEYFRVNYKTSAGGWDQSYDGAQEIIFALAVYDGKLYAGQGLNTGDGDVLVYDGTTWSVSYDGAQERISALAVYDGKLYAGQGDGTGDGDVLVYDGTTWSVSYDGAQESILALAVYDGKLYAGQGTGTGDGDVLVYDGTTWSVSYDGAQESISAFAVYDGKLYAGQGDGTGDGDVLVYDGTTWSVSYDGAQETIFALAVYDGKLYAGQGFGAGDGDVLVYDGTTWSVSYDGAQEIISAFAVYDGKLYAGQGTGAGDGDVLVYDGTTWSVSYDGAQERILALAVYDGKLYAGQGFGAGDGDVYRFTSTGTTTILDPLEHSYSTNAIISLVNEVFLQSATPTNLTEVIRIVTETNQNFNVILDYRGIK
jgi:hypothetical protein